MNVIHMTPGEYIAYETTKKSIVFGDEDLSINLKNREQDEKVTIDVCFDRDGNLTMGTAAGLHYVAQVEIPPRQYKEVEQENPDYEEGGEAPATITVLEPVAFDIDNCTLYLWSI
ncbi:hypothetical protein EI53_01242 [Fusobacterium naviforme]|nr:hypothetical protein F7P78_06205 [Fusobacterium naviforme]PSL10180.1 hypothetical protein EI53_01242 [Fusobacterium naviforme]STO27590.1 Uncharacterised protein [Fusobacterium naviforme]